MTVYRDDRGIPNIYAANQHDLFNRGPYPVSGSTSLVNACNWSARESFEVVLAP